MSTDTAFALGVLALVAPGGDAAARLPAHARGLRRPRRAAGDRDRLHGARLGRPARGRRRPLRRCWSRSATRPSRGAGRWRSSSAWRCGSRCSKSGIDPVISGLAVGLVTERISARARRPRAGHRAHALVPRAADARARALGPARRRLGDLGERAAPVPPPSVDELRDRPAVRARERRHPHRRRAARRRRHVADHARNHLSATCVGKPIGIVAAHVARVAAVARRAAPAGQLAGADRRAARSPASASPSRC